MVNQELKTQEVLPQETIRDIELVTSEIVSICNQAQSMVLMYAIEVGRRLKEAKSILPHGEWGNWLKEKVNFSHSTANTYMKLFEEYGIKANSQALVNLTFTTSL